MPRGDDGPYPRPVSSPRDLLRTIREELRQLFLERAELIDGALVALLAGQHVLVIGPPGTAKSMLADEVCRRITGAQLLPVAADALHHARGALRRRQPEGARGGRLPAPHHPQAARGAHRLPRRGVQGELVDPEHHPDAHERAPLPQRARGHAGAAAHALRRLQRAARGRRAAGAQRPLPAALRGRLHGRGLPLPEAPPGPAAGGPHHAVARRARGRARRGGRASPCRARCCARSPTCAASSGAGASSPPTGAGRSRSACCARTPGWTAATPSATTTSRSSSTSSGAIPAERQTVREAIRELLHGYEDEVRVLLYQSRELRDYALREWDDAASCAAAPRVEAHTKLRNILGKVDDILAAARRGGRPTADGRGAAARDRRHRAGDAGAALIAPDDRRRDDPHPATPALLDRERRLRPQRLRGARRRHAVAGGGRSSAAAALVPHFRELLEDLFCLLYKLEPRWRADRRRGGGGRAQPRAARRAARPPAARAAARARPSSTSRRRGSAHCSSASTASDSCARSASCRAATCSTSGTSSDRRRSSGAAARSSTNLDGSRRRAPSRAPSARASGRAVARRELRQKAAQRRASGSREMPSRARAAVPAGVGRPAPRAGGDRRGGAELGHRPGRWRAALARAADRARPAARHQPEAAPPGGAGRPHAGSRRSRSAGARLERTSEEVFAVELGQRRSSACCRPSCWRCAIRRCAATSSAGSSRGSSSPTRCAAPTSAAAAR